MEDWERGTVVRSLAGRDKGRLLVVLGARDGSVLAADGKERPLERPKKKNPKHLQALEAGLFTWQLRGNRALRRELNRLAGRQAEEIGV